MTRFRAAGLLHDHTDEQPFTRELHGVHVPNGFPQGVLIREHHNIRGYDGAALKLDLPITIRPIP